MRWNPDTSQITLPPTSNLTTPAPELFSPESPPESICANSAQPGDLIGVVFPNDTQVIYFYVGAIKVTYSADVRSKEYDGWGKVTFRDNPYYPETMDEGEFETKIYAPPALSVPLPDGVTPGMVTASMITGGEHEEWINPEGTPIIAGCPCVTASLLKYQGIERKRCYHVDNFDDTETAFRALPPELGFGRCISKRRRILSTYIIVITFPFPRQSPPPPLAPILAALGVLSLCCIGAAGAGNAAANALKRRHQPTWQA